MKRIVLILAVLVSLALEGCSLEQPPPANPAPIDPKTKRDRDGC